MPALEAPAKPEVGEEARGSRDGVSSEVSQASKVMQASAGRLAAVTASLQAANAEDKHAKKEKAKEKKKEEQKKKKQGEPKAKAKPAGKAKAKPAGKAKGKAKPAKRADDAETEDGEVTEPAASSAPAGKAKSTKRPIPDDDVKKQMRCGTPRTKVALRMKWGCSKCVFKPGCTPSCWKQRNQQKPE